MRNDSGWNVTMRDGVAVGFLCPGCQTVEENAEAEMNVATTSYAIDPLGRVTGAPKTAEEDLTIDLAPVSAEGIAALMGVTTADVLLVADRGEEFPPAWVENGERRREEYERITGRSDLRGAIEFWLRRDTEGGAN